MKLMKERKAFTIVEMVIVIAVIAILATVLVPTISGVIDKANHSADQQFVASLNIQLALWQVDNGQIRSEADLQLAINQYYNENNPGFYETLAPKSANRGYHFWWDIANGQVILETYDKLADIVTPSAIGGANTFEVGNPRTLTTTSGTYFLMDQGGSNVADLLVDLRSVDSSVGYADVIAKIEALEGDTNLAAVLATNLKSSALANVEGLFIAGSNVTSVYVPAYPMVVTLGNSTASASELAAVDHINLPAYISLLSWSMQNFNTGKTPADANCSNFATIYTNVDEEELENYFGLNSTDCILQRPDGTRYVVDGEGIWRLPDRIKVGEPGYTQPLTFDIAVDDSSASVARIKDGVLYVAFNSGTVTLNVTKIAPISLAGASWAVSDNTITFTSDAAANAATFTIPANASDFTVTAALPGGTKSIDVKIVKITNVYLTESALGDLSYSVSANNDDDADYPNLDITLPYKITGSRAWTLVPSYELNHPDCGLSIVGTFDITTSDKLDYNPNNNTLSILPTVAGSHSVSVNFIYSGVTGSPTYTFKLEDQSEAGFTIADNVKKKQDYGITYHVGKSDTIPLSVLFKADGYTSGKIFVDVYDAAGTDKLKDTQEFTAISGGLNLSGITAGQTVKVKIGVGGAQYALDVKVVNGKNVTNASQWASVTGTGDATSAGLVLHADLKNFADGTGCITVTNGTVYGNLHTISWDDGSYLVKNQADNAIITLNNGTIDNLVINGPTYTSTSTWGDAASTGVYVFGVYANGTATINNSYISGFMAPVGAKTTGKTVNLNSTVLKGGAMGNIYVNQSSITLNITDCTLIRSNEGNLSAPGIYLDEKATGTTINLLGATTLYTYTTESGAKTLPGMSDLNSLGYADNIIVTVAKNVGIHTVGGTTYVHTGVMMHGSATVTDWSNNDTCSVNGVTYKYTEQTLFGYGAKMCAMLGDTVKCKNTSRLHNCMTDVFGGASGCGIGALNNDNCGKCDASSSAHTLTPTWGSSAAEYLNHRASQS